MNGRPMEHYYIVQDKASILYIGDYRNTLAEASEAIERRDSGRRVFHRCSV